MNTMRSIIGICLQLITLTLLVIMGCKPVPLPTNSETSIVFSLTGRAGDEAFQWSAGVGDYVMQTAYRREENTYMLWGRLGPIQCTNCPNMIEIRLRDEQSVVPAQFEVAQAFETGARDYLADGGANPGGIRRIAFSTSSFPEPAKSYRWDFGDGNIGVGPEIIHGYTDSTLDQVEVCLEAESPDGCISQVCNQVDLGEAACGVDFGYSVGSEGFVGFIATPVGTPPFTYKWDLGDGFTTNLPNPGYQYARPGRYEVCLTITDNAGCEQTICKPVSADSNVCAHGFSYQRLSIIPDPTPVQEVEIVWWDQAGNVYQSSWGEQPAEAFFFIDQSEAYTEQEGPSTIQKSTIRFAATIYALDGQAIPIEGRGTFGFGHP